MSALEISAIVPAYNEQGAVGPVVSGLSELLRKHAARFEIIAVDDGSTDSTAEAAEKAGAVVLRHPVNRGYGRSLLTGIEKARYEWILIIDGDGSYPPEEAERLLPKAPACDLIIGKREGKFFWGNPLQAFMRWCYLAMAGFVTGESIPDANSGMRLFRKSSLDRSMPFVCLGYSFTTTMTLSFIAAGRFVAYVPIRFVERRGHSKVKPPRDILRTLQIMTQMLLYYNPLKLAVSLSAGSAVAALAIFLFLSPRWGIHSAFFAACVPASLAVLIFLAGCLMDAVRMHFQARNGGYKI